MRFSLRYPFGFIRMASYVCQDHKYMFQENLNRFTLHALKRPQFVKPAENLARFDPRKSSDEAT